MTEILDARDAVERILDEYGLRAFIYTVEPKPDGCLLIVDCAAEDGWKHIAFAVEPAELRASLHDERLRAKLRREWEPHFRGCARRVAAGREAGAAAGTQRGA
jgi:hypothetical protein